MSNDKDDLDAFLSAIGAAGLDVIVVNSNMNIEKELAKRGFFPEGSIPKCEICGGDHPTPTVESFLDADDKEVARAAFKESVVRKIEYLRSYMEDTKTQIELLQELLNLIPSDLMTDKMRMIDVVVNLTNSVKDMNRKARQAEQRG